jgi:hypothetical protein
MLFLENIFFLCNCLKPSYVMPFDVIPIFFSFLNATKNNIDIRPGPPKKLELRWQTFLMLIFLWLQKLVDVGHLRLSMLIFLLLVPNPKKWQDLYLSSRAQINYCSWVFLKYTFLTHKDNWKPKNVWTYFCWKYTNKCVSNKPSQKNNLQF